jgi:hypothetical protein
MDAEQINYHASRNSNISDYKREKNEQLNLPPSHDNQAWKEINDELKEALPLVFTDIMFATLSTSVLAKKIDDWIYAFLLERCGIKPQKNYNAKSSPSPRRKNIDILRLKAELRTCKSACKVLSDAGFDDDSEEHIALNLRLAGIKTRYHRLRYALAKKSNQLNSVRARRKFKANPHKFASELFNDSSKSASPTFDKDVAQGYYAKTYRDTNRDHKYSPLSGMNHPPVPKLIFSKEPRHGKN